MADSLRDRVLTPAGARAITHPAAIVAAGAVAAAVLAASLPAVAAVGLGAAAWGGIVANRLPRAARGVDDVDLKGLAEPWRRYVVEALAARSRFLTAVRGVRSGPLRRRLDGIGGRVDDGVVEVERIARHGDRLDMAMRQLEDPAVLRRQLTDAEGRPGTPEQVLQSLRSQLASTERIVLVAVDTRQRLEVLDAQLDELVARVVELSLRQGDAEAAGPLGSDVDALVDEMESLRVALDDADAW
jgi:hypothetical protein